MITKYANKIKNYIPSFLYKPAAQAFIDRVYPRHLFIEVTANCNLSCSYCPREKETQDMDFRLFRKIADESRQYGARSFSLHLFGEPTLYPRLFDAIAYLKKCNSHHTVLLTTNGTRLNECIDDLTASKTDQVLWTWRREARFTESTLLKLRKWGKFRVRFIDGITPDSAREEWKDWGNVESRRMHNYGANIDTSRFQIGKKLFTTAKDADTKRWPCYHLWLAPAVAWNGKFLLCCADPHQKEVFGDANKEEVSVAWQRVERVRQSHLRGEYEGICKNCDVWKEYGDIWFDFQKFKRS